MKDMNWYDDCFFGSNLLFVAEAMSFNSCKYKFWSDAQMAKFSLTSNAWRKLGGPGHLTVKTEIF